MFYTSGSPSYENEYFEDDFGGLIPSLKHSVSYAEDGTVISESTTTREYDANGNLIAQKEENLTDFFMSNSFTFEYDTDGKLSKSIHTFMWFEEETLYNSNQDIEKITTKNQNDGKISNIKNYKNGEPVSYTTYTYYADSEIKDTEVTSEMVKQYNGSYAIGGEIERIEYYNTGKKKSQSGINEDGDSYQISYNEQEIKTEEKVYDKSAYLKKWFRISDEVSEISETIYGKDFKRESKTVYDEQGKIKFEYSYYPNGITVKKLITYENGVKKNEKSYSEGGVELTNTNFE